MKFGIFYEHQIPRPLDVNAEHRIAEPTVRRRSRTRPGAVALTTGRAGVILEALGVANTTPQRPFNLAHYLLARDAMNGQAAGSFAPAEGGEK
jgi:hypothetical protein